jgi:hypothetical protein
MARPVDMTWAIEQAKKKKLHVHGGVKWKNAWYIIWKDDIGPVYSSLANIGLIRKLGGTTGFTWTTGLIPLPIG